MADKQPGPSQGDAAEYIESLGFDPWKFAALEIVRETSLGQMSISEFEVRGSSEDLDALQRAHEHNHPNPSLPVDMTKAREFAFKQC